MIDVIDLTFAYRGEQLLFDKFAFSIQPGESWSIIGPSGCGKTTLLYLLAGLYSPTSGQIIIGNQPIVRPRPLTGLVLQDHGLLPWATVRENIALGVKIRKFYGPDGKHVPTNISLNAENIEDLIDSWLRKLGIETLRDKYPSQISGGERQRTAIARTLLLEPDLLLLDEPFSALDAPTRLELEQILLDLTREQYLTLVIVTHDIEVAATMGEKIMVLNKIINRQPRIVQNTLVEESGKETSEVFKAFTRSLHQLIENQ